MTMLDTQKIENICFSLRIIQFCLLLFIIDARGVEQLAEIITSCLLILYKIEMFIRSLRQAYSWPINILMPWTSPEVYLENRS